MAHPKGVLIERLQQQGRGAPEFRSERSGPDHQPTFASEVLLDGKVIGTGSGSSKREAERDAAGEALRALGDATNGSKAKGKRSAGRSASGAATEADPADAGDEGFDGPWPVFEAVLASAMQIAERRVADNLRGTEARVAVRDFTLQLYKELLEDLGDVIEDEDEDQD